MGKEMVDYYLFREAEFGLQYGIIIRYAEVSCADVD